MYYVADMVIGIPRANNPCILVANHSLRKPAALVAVFLSPAPCSHFLTTFESKLEAVLRYQPDLDADFSGGSVLSFLAFSLSLSN